VLAQHRNFGEFKVPGLRHVAQTAPYLHDGQKATLADVVDHYDTLSPDRLHADGEQILKPLQLRGTERADLLAFLPRTVTLLLPGLHLCFSSSLSSAIRSDIPPCLDRFPQPLAPGGFDELDDQRTPPRSHARRCVSTCSPSWTASRGTSIRWWMSTCCSPSRRRRRRNEGSVPK
jgi:hypothetical protein